MKTENQLKTALNFIFGMLLLSQSCLGQCVNPAWSGAKHWSTYSVGELYSEDDKDYVVHTPSWCQSYSPSSANGNLGFTLSADPCDAGASAPVMSLTGSSSVTCTTADLTANISDIGGSNVTTRGFIYGTVEADVDASTEAALVGTSAKSTDVGSYGTGDYTIGVASLTSSTTYYIRAFSINSTGTTYAASTKSFFTCAVVPTVSSAAITNLSCTSVTSGGTVSLDGGDAVTVRGVCWSTSTGPTTADSKTSDGAGIGLFGSSVTGLTASTLYYLKSYATNGIGTAYGNEISFTTSAGCIPTYYSCAAVNSWSLLQDCSTSDGTPGNTDRAILRHDWFNSAQTYSLANLAWGQGAGIWFDAKPLKLTIETGGRAVFNTTSYGGLPGTFSLVVNPGGIFASYTSLEVINSFENHGSVHLFGAVTNGNDITGTGEICYSGNFENSTLGGSLNGAFTSAIEATLQTDFFTTNNAALGGNCGSLAGVLPIELTHFEAIKKDGFVEVEWITSSEINSDYFEVELSIDAVHWNLLDKVSAAGNSTTTKYYSTADWNVEGYTRKYYRLKQHDFDGKIKRSDIKVLDFGEKGEVKTFTDGSSLVAMLVGVTENITVQLYDISGSLISMSGTSEIINGNSAVVFDLHGKSRGMYFVKVYYNHKQFGQKVLINSLN